MNFGSQAFINEPCKFKSNCLFKRLVKIWKIDNKNHLRKDESSSSAKKIKIKNVDIFIYCKVS